MYSQHFSGEAAKGIGGIMVIAALVSWSAASTAWWSNATYCDVSCGYWCGSVFLIVGITAIFAGKSKTNGAVVICFIMALISFVFANIQLGFSASGLHIDLEDHYSSSWNHWWKVASNITLVSAASVQIILSVVLAIVCIVAMCSDSNVEPSAAQTSPQQPMQPMQQIHIVTPSNPPPQNVTYMVYTTAPQNQGISVVSPQPPPPDYSKY